MLPAGTTCGILTNTQDDVTKNFIYPLECPANTNGRYVQLQRNQHYFTVMEIEVYIPTTGKGGKTAKTDSGIEIILPK